MSPAWYEVFGWGRTPALPQDVRDAVGTPRALAACRVRDGDWLVGTRDALIHVADPPRRWPWEQVLRAEWEQEPEQLTVVPLGEFGHPVEQVRLQLLDAADLLSLVRERVSASVVMQTRVIVSGKQGFQVFARRSPSGGPLAWAFELDEGLDPQAPEVEQLMDQALLEAKASLGELG